MSWDQIWIVICMFSTSGTQLIHDIMFADKKKGYADRFTKFNYRNMPFTNMYRKIIE